MNDAYGDPRNFDPNVVGYDPYEDPNVWGNPYEPPPITIPPVTTAPTTPVTPTTTGGGGKTPAQIEAEGREYDRQHGLIGGYMMDGQWVNGSPYGGHVDTGGDGSPRTLDMSGSEPPPFNWSRFAPTPFTSRFGPYTPTTLAEAESDPGYAFARDQGRKTLENSAAGRGVLRTGGTLKDILEYGNRFAQQNYESVDNRRFRNWGANVDNEFRAYDTNYRGEKDAFDATHDAERLTFADQYNRWKSKLDALTNLSVAGLNS